MRKSERNRGEETRQAAGNKPAAKTEAAVRALQRAAADPASASPQEIWALQRKVGNRAVVRLMGGATTHARIQPKLTVGPAADRYEQEADRAAERVTGISEASVATSATAPLANLPAMQRAADSGAGFEAGPELEASLASSRGSGSPLPASTRAFMEPRFGADFSGVRVHTGAQAAQMNRDMQAQAFTHGRDIYFDAGKYQPGTSAGNHLLAHELTHVVQQGSARVAAGAQRKPEMNVAEVQGRLPANRVSAKKRKVHLDFVKMKRKNAHIGMALQKSLGMQVPRRDLYGHWWTEIGNLNANNDWVPTESFGWWPSIKVNTQQTLRGVPGVLNKGLTADPHQGDKGDTEFHPVMTVDDAADYDTVRADIEGKIRSFASGFKGAWNWRFGWGKNCQSFQRRLKKHAHLHFQKSNHWLRDPKVLDAQRQQREALEKQQAALKPQPDEWITIPGFLSHYDLDGGKKGYLGMLRPDTKIGITGRAEAGYGQIAISEGSVMKWFWVSLREFQNMMGRPYPGSEPESSGQSGNLGDTTQPMTDGGGQLAEDSDTEAVGVEIPDVASPQGDGQGETQGPLNSSESQDQPGYRPPPKWELVTLSGPLNMTIEKARVTHAPGPFTLPAGTRLMILDRLDANTIEVEAENIGVGPVSVAELGAAVGAL